MSTIDKEKIFKIYFFSVALILIFLYHLQFINLDRWRFDLLLIIAGVMGIFLLLFFVFDLEG